MNDDHLPEHTIASMAHGRTTVQAWWRESSYTESGRALSWGVNGEEVDHNRVRELVEAGDPAAATLIGLWAMTAPKDGSAGHVQPPWRLTDYGKTLAGECPCGPCTWKDPPARKRRQASAPVEVNARQRREAKRANDRWYREQIEAEERRRREAKLDLAERRRLREERLERLVAEARAERWEAAQKTIDALRGAAEHDQANREARAARRGAGGTFRKPDAPAPSAEAIREARVRAGKASGAARRAKAAKAAK